ncbi:MAG: VOC family protein [Desertimonas sp.]
MTLQDTRFGGINHLALVCQDMQRTVDFYQGVLGMPLIKTIELPQGMGQHFFFDCGGDDCVAFFWFADAPERAPGIASPAEFPGAGELATAHGSMNHVAFSVPPERIEALRDQLIEHGIECTTIFNHDDSEYGVAREFNDDVFVRSVYFFDPDGILLEFACWTREFGPDDVAHAPARAADARPPAAITTVGA